MNVTDEQLMAYVDGELEGEAGAAVAHAIEMDSALAKKVEQYRALRRRLSGAFDPILHEPVPEKLVAATQGSNAPATSVTVLSAIRAARSSATRTGFTSWLPIAASVVFGVLIGFVAFRGDRDAVVANANGVIAQGNLARTLTEDLASRPSPNSAIRIGATYEASSGDYCRTFVVADERNVAGIACLPHGASNIVWRIRVLVPAEATSDANYRTAASAIPASVIDQVNKDIKGEPLDAEEEARIVSRRWNSR